MKYKKLVIVDLKSDLRIIYNDVIYIYLNNGKIEFKNSKRLFFNSLRKKLYLKLKKNFINKLIDKVNKSEKIINFFPEFDFFNLRNDRDNNFDLVVNLLLLNQFKKKLKIKDTVIITDNDLTRSFFSKNKKNKVLYKGKNPNFDLGFYNLKILKFYLKSFFVVILSKLLKNNSRVSEEACITHYPIFFKGNEEKFYYKKNSIKFNFLLGDETQLNLSFYDVFKILYKNRSKNIINIESQISIFDIIKSYFKTLNNLRLMRKIDYDLILENYNFKKFYKKKIYSSFVNRSKLSIYNNAIKQTLELYNIKKVNLYLFEYNFGFYLIRKIKENFKNIKIVGFQHGVFYKNLLWLEVVSKINSSKNYHPHTIYAFTNNIIKDYKTFYGNKNLKYILREKKLSDVSKKIKYNKSNNILILTGTHDVKDIVKAILHKKKNNTNKQFNYFFKFHPKKKIILAKDVQIKSIEKLDKIKFGKVVISPTSTIIYDMIKLKKPFYVFDIDYKFNYVFNISKFR